jgi:hypothetical protein
MTYPYQCKENNVYFVLKKVCRLYRMRHHEGATLYKQKYPLAFRCPNAHCEPMIWLVDVFTVYSQTELTTSPRATHPYLTRAVLFRPCIRFQIVY